jgi:hypothetical protein
MMMKLGRKFFGLVLCFFACVVLFSATAGPVVAEVSITGTVYADDWDHEGKVDLVVIETPEGELYYVSGDAKGKELLKLVEKNVKVTGVIDDTGGERIIKVMTYEVVE